MSGKQWRDCVDSQRPKRKRKTYSKGEASYSLYGCRPVYPQLPKYS